MKEWLRQHPDHVPPGLDATSSTSYELRNGFKKMGWSVQITKSEVRLVKPGVASLEPNVGAVLGGDDMEERAQTEAVFALEYQLRDFIAQNLNSIPVEGRKRCLYVDATGRDGIEFPTTVGPIDILAVDDTGAFVVLN